LKEVEIVRCRGWRCSSVVVTLRATSAVLGCAARRAATTLPGLSAIFHTQKKTPSEQNSEGVF
jgi:hypothetical protein